MLAHTPLGLGRRLGCSALAFWVGGGGSGVSVRARGLCDISRLPIWLGEWTRSNYSCSYCLINLPVSLLRPHPLTLYLFSFSPAKEGGSKCVRVSRVARHQKTQTHTRKKKIKFLKRMESSSVNGFACDSSGKKRKLENSS